MPLDLTPGQRHEAVVLEQLMPTGAFQPGGQAVPNTAHAGSWGIKGTAAGGFGTRRASMGFESPFRASAPKVAPAHLLACATVSAPASSA